MVKAPNTFESPFQVYSVTAVLGEGGSGRVFSVKNGDGQAFALKCLFPDRVTTERKKRFKNEIDFCSKCRHTNVIQVKDYGLANWDGKKCPFYVMSIFPTTLRLMVDKKLSSEKALPIFNQVLNGVEAAHLLGVIHRDLKPENILYDPQRDLAAIADFAIAHFTEDIIATTVETGATARMANLRYSAPEQRAKGTRVDLRADIFALGLIINEMFTGSVPQGAGYKTIGQVAPSFAYLDPIVEKMIQQDPGARPSCIADIKKELIGRRNEFVTLQELDAKRREIVPAAAPPTIEPIQLVSVDWDRGTLILNLNREPERGWVTRFQRPRGGHGAISGYGPENFEFQGDVARIRVEERLVQDIVNHFKTYAQMANVGYQEDRQAYAKQIEQEYRERLVRETAEAEARHRIIKNVKM